MKGVEPVTAVGVVPPSELASAPASAAWPGVSIFSTHTLPNHQTQQTPITTVPAQFVASFLLNVQVWAPQELSIFATFLSESAVAAAESWQGGCCWGENPGGRRRQQPARLYLPPCPPPLFNAANALRMGAGSIGQLDPENLEQSNQRPNEPV